MLTLPAIVDLNEELAREQQDTVIPHNGIVFHICTANVWTSSGPVSCFVSRHRVARSHLSRAIVKGRMIKGPVVSVVPVSYGGGDVKTMGTYKQAAVRSLSNKVR